ncbi:MAG: glycosyltransferase family 4 protein [Candidatus Scalindua sp.]
MNILFVTNNFPPMDGGVAVFNYHICKELGNQGHKILVVANEFHNSKSFDLKQEFKIKRLNIKIRPTSLGVIYRILSETVKEKIDVIFYGHFGSTHWLSGSLAQRIFKVPYLILIHGTDLNEYFYRFTKMDNWTSRIVLENAAQIIVNSQATKRLVEEHSYPSEKIHIVHPGASPELFNIANQGEEIRTKYKLEGRKVLLSISRLVPKKNHVNVLKALPEVIKRISNLTYLIVGKGEEEEIIKRIIGELRLQGYVKLLGYIDPQYIAPYYNACDVFVMPSKTVDVDYESFGIVYIEANACGKPVIGGRSGGVEDAVIDGVTGLLVDPENINEISDAIIRLLNDENLARRLGGNGRKRVENELTWKIVGKKINKIIERMVSNN